MKHLPKPLPESGFFIPEIHDVHPGMETPILDMLNLLPEDAREKSVLGVVGNWEEKWPLANYPEFIEQIKSLPNLIVNHGWTHSRGPDFWNWLAYNQENRSEFQSVDRNEANARLEKSENALDAAFGTVPKWFCAPRWKMSDGTRQVLQQRKYLGCLNANTIEYFGKATVPMPVLSFDEGDRVLKSRAACVFRQPKIDRLFRKRQPFRLVLHPMDLHRPKEKRQIDELIARLKSDGWRASSLDDFLAAYETE